MMQKLKHARALRIAEYAVFAIASAYLFLHTLPRAWGTLNTDFPNYYLAARIVHEGTDPSRAYEWLWLQRQKDHRDIDQRVIGLVPITPFSTLAMWPITRMPPLVAKRVWLAVNLALLIASAFVLRSITGLTLSQIGILIEISFPLHRNLLYGQYYVVLPFILAAACWACLRQKRAIAGSLVGIGIAVKVFPVLLCFYFLRKKEWRSLVACAFTCVFAALLSIAVFGWSLHRIYIFEVLPWTLRGDCLDPYNLASSSFSSLLHRLFIYEPQWNPHPAFAVPWLFAILHPLLQMAILAPVVLLIGRVTRTDIQDALARQRISLEWATLLLATLTITPLPASYHFTVLILPAAILIGHLVEARRFKLLAIVAALYLAVGYPGWNTDSVDGLFALLHVPRLYAMMLLTAVSAYVLRGLSAGDRDVHALRWKMALAAMCIVSAALGLQHQWGLFADYQYRLPMPQQSLLAAQPQSSDDGVHFIALMPDGYREATTHNSFASESSVLDSAVFVEDTREDQLSHAFVAGQPADGGWIESVTQNSLLQSRSNQIFRIEGAQSPAISADGHSLGYLREVEGRNQIYLRRLDLQASYEQQITSSSMNVNEMTLLRDGSIIFSASTKTYAPDLYRVDRNGIVQRLALGEARYPAVSPDGRWLAFSRFQQGAWNLWLLSLATGKTQRITTAPCNQIEPAWEADSKTLLYGSDCGRALWFTAVCRRRILP